MRKKKSLTIMATILLTIMGMMLFVSLFGQTNFSLEAFQFRLALQFSEKGITQVEIPPLGLIKAHTHQTPVKIIVRLENIDLELLKEFVSDSPQQTKIISDIRSQSKHILTIYVFKLLLLSALGGAFGVFLIRRKGIIPLLQGALGGLILAVILLAGTYFTYDTREFQKPKYEGVLRAAPWMVSLAEQTFGKIETLTEKMQVVATNLYDLFEQIENLKPLTETANDIKVLHVSDTHNNPAGIEFIHSVARLFDADLIIDTGDISDFGTPLEALLLDRLKKLDKPYLFIPGNHDSPDIVEHLSQIPEVTVLDGLTEINGLRIIGFPDPASFGPDVVPPSIDDIPQYVDQIKEKLFQVPGGVNILALHNHDMAKELAGYAPVIVFGHNHQLAIETKRDSVLVNAGTSGASGIRGLQSFNSPYSVVLLYFRRIDEKIKLVAADSIKVNNLKQGFTLERKVFNKEKELPAENPDNQVLNLKSYFD
ncbi:MAG: hypothetical protein FH756_19905 [Firmicutes bacterium]|nr:hypothetical protein [Bacillota bacterium]